MQERFAFRTVRSLSPLQSLLVRNWRPQWCCAARQPSWLAQRTLATGPESTSEKPYYATTPIFYVNAAPHIGHMYTMVLTDVMKRWQVLKGRKAVLSTGTDEHGLKIQQAAKKADMDPLAFCNNGVEVFKELAGRSKTSYDTFVRTSDKGYKEAVEYAWCILQDRGYIYKSKHAGWYSVSDEAFFPENTVHMILDPRTGRKLMASKETGNEVTWSEEENHHFRLSAFRDDLLDFYRANPEWITPPARMKEVVSAVETGLEDLSVSRPYERLQWAVRVPTDHKQSIYVWLDALLNYATTAGYPWTPGPDMGGWPADVHVIGKDIIRFHCIYWPAFLMALDLPLPKRIMTHAHWQMDSRKMSKSIGNVVNPFWAMDRFGVETMRFVLVHHGGLADDVDYDNKHIVARYKTDLQNRLGNLLARVVQSRKYDAEYVSAMYGGKMELLERDCVGHSVQPPHDATKARDHAVNWSLEEYRRMLVDLPTKVDECFARMEPNIGLRTLMTAVYAANALIQNYAPWTMMKQMESLKQQGESAVQERARLEKRVACVLFLMTETLRMVGIMLQPVMPSKGAQLLDSLHVEGGRRSFADAKLCADSSYRPRQQLEDEVELLFPPLANIG